MKGSAGRERNFFHTSASRLKAETVLVRSKNKQCQWTLGGRLLLRIGDMFLHVVQCALSDPFLKYQVFELVPVTVILNSCSNFTETVQKDFLIRTVLLIVPENQDNVFSFCRKIKTKREYKRNAYLSKLQHGLKRSTRILIFSSSPKERYGMIRRRPCKTLGLERTKGVLI